MSQVFAAAGQSIGVSASTSVIQIVNTAGSLNKQENSRETPTSALLTMPKPLAL